MKLFHESENKYYELLAYLVNGDTEYSMKGIRSLCEVTLKDSRDYTVEETLFDDNSSSVFVSNNKNYVPAIQCHFPVRNTRIELQAVRSLAGILYAKHFLRQETICKLQRSADEISEEWSLEDIQIQNQYGGGLRTSDAIHEKTLRIIISAINSNRNIICDNVAPGRFEYRQRSIFPVKVEYSFINDVFRVCAYDQDEDRFIKLNLVSLSNVQLGEERIEKLQDEYREYIELHTKKIVLDLEPSNNVIERCFRIFSYYERLARYDKDNDHYTLEISYLKADEAEVIRDILSLGGCVIVTEPRRIQKEVYKRILMARDNYKQ